MIFGSFSDIENIKQVPLLVKEMAFVKNSKNMSKTQVDACNAVASAFVKNQPIQRTKPCYYGDSCNKADCAFAHSKEELSPKMCMYDARCKNEECLFKHSDQSLDEYCEVNGFFQTNEMMAPYFDPFEIMDEIEEVNLFIQQQAWEEEQREMQAFANEVDFFDWIGDMEGENDNEEVVF